MKIHFTENAKQAILKQMKRDDIQLKLVYDSEGCGCAVSGVPTLWAEDNQSEADMQAQSNAFPITYNKHQEVFFEDEMTVDLNQSNGLLVLKSKSQIYNGMMKLVDKTAVRSKE